MVCKRPLHPLRVQASSEFVPFRNAPPPTTPWRNRRGWSFETGSREIRPRTMVDFVDTLSTCLPPSWKKTSFFPAVLDPTLRPFAPDAWTRNAGHRAALVCIARRCDHAEMAGSFMEHGASCGPSAMSLLSDLEWLVKYTECARNRQRGSVDRADGQRGQGIARAKSSNPDVPESRNRQFPPPYHPTSTSPLRGRCVSSDVMRQFTSYKPFNQTS